MTIVARLKLLTREYRSPFRFLPGEQSGNALAAVIAGDVDPGGRLPLSFPASQNQSWLQSESQYPGLEQPGDGQPRYIATYTGEESSCSHSTVSCCACASMTSMQMHCACHSQMHCAS